MGLVIRQSIYTTIITYIGVVIGYVNFMYLFPKFLQPEQVGLLRTIQDAAILFAPFAQFGLAQTIFRFHPKLVKDDRSEKLFINTILVLGLVGFGIFFAVFQLFQKQIISYFEENAADVIQYSNLILWFTFVMLMSALIESYSKSLLRTVVPNLVKEVLIRILLGVLVTTYFFGWISYDWFIISTVLSYVLCLIILIAYLFYEGKLAFIFNLSIIQSPDFIPLVRYSFLSFAGAAGMIIIGKIDSIMVAGLAGLKAVAIYTTGFYMATVIEVPKRALAQLALPLISRAFEKNDLNDVAIIYRKTAINQFIIGSLLLIGIYINLDNIFSLMPKKEIYEAGRWVVVIIGIGKLTDMLFGPSSEIIVLSKYYWLNMVLIIFLAGMVVVANNQLIPIYGINGAAMGAALALVLFNIAKFIFIWAKLRLQPFDVSFLKALLIAGATLAIDFALPKINSIFIDLLFRSVIATLFFGSATLLWRVSPDANGLFVSVLKRAGIRK